MNIRNGKLLLLITLVAAILAGTGCQASPPASLTSPPQTQAPAQTTRPADTAAAPAPTAEPFQGEMSMYYSAHPSIPANPDWIVWDYIQDMTGVKVNLSGDAGEAYTTKLNLMITSGTLPDLFQVTMPVLKTFFDSGVFLPINEHLDQTPNFKLVHDRHYDTGIKYYYTVDGKLFLYNQITDYVSVENVVCAGVRKDIYEENGIALPTTWDEAYDSLVQLKTAYPDLYPFCIVGGTPSFVLSDFAYMWGTGPLLYYDEIAKTYAVGPMEDNFKQMVLWLNKCYTQKLLDPEYLTITVNEFRDRFMGFGNPIYFFVDNSALEAYESIALSRDANQVIDLAPLAPLDVAPGVGGRIPLKTVVRDRGYSVSAKTQNLDAILRFMDFCYSDEGTEFLAYGPEELEISIVTDGGPLKGGYYETNPKWSGVDVSQNYSTLYGFSVDCTRMRMLDTETYRLQSPDIAKYSDDIIAAGRTFKRTTLPLFSAQEQEEYNEIYAKLNDLAIENVEKFILGTQNTDADWDNFIVKMNDAGAQRLVDLCNQAVSRLN